MFVRNMRLGGPSLETVPVWRASNSDSSTHEVSNVHARGIERRCRGRGPAGRRAKRRRRRSRDRGTGASVLALLGGRLGRPVFQERRACARHAVQGTAAGRAISGLVDLTDFLLGPRAAPDLKAERRVRERATRWLIRGATGFPFDWHAQLLPIDLACPCRRDLGGSSGHGCRRHRRLEESASLKRQRLGASHKEQQARDDERVHQWRRRRDIKFGEIKLAPKSRSFISPPPPCPATTVDARRPPSCRSLAAALHGRGVCSAAVRSARAGTPRARPSATPCPLPLQPALAPARAHHAALLFHDRPCYCCAGARSCEPGHAPASSIPESIRT